MNQDFYYSPQVHYSSKTDACVKANITQNETKAGVNSLNRPKDSPAQSITYVTYAHSNNI